MIAYRICELKDGQLHTLFHRHGGTRVLEAGVWYEAETKRVRDGAGDCWYESGFHVVPDWETVKRFLRRFRAPRVLVVVECEVEDVRRKPRSEAWLAKKIRILPGIVARYVPPAGEIQEDPDVRSDSQATATGN